MKALTTTTGVETQQSLATLRLPLSWKTPGETSSISACCCCRAGHGELLPLPRRPRFLKAPCHCLDADPPRPLEGALRHPSLPVPKVPHTAGDQKLFRALSYIKAFKGLSPCRKTTKQTPQHSTQDPFQWVLTELSSTTWTPSALCAYVSLPVLLPLP